MGPTGLEADALQGRGQVSYTAGLLSGRTAGIATKERSGLRAAGPARLAALLHRPIKSFPR